MKFTNGNWMLREGVKGSFPAEVYRYKVENNIIKILAPTHPIAHRGMTLMGVVLNIELSSPMPGVIKVKTYHHKGKKVSGPSFELKKDEATGVIRETEDRISLTSGDLTVEVAKTGQWCVAFLDSKGNELTHSGFRNLGYMEVSEEAVAVDLKSTYSANGILGASGPYMKEELHLSVDEKVYGLGERFTPLIKNGQTVDIWNEDGGTSSEQSYKNIPFYLSSKGYGVLVNHPEKVSFEVGSEKVTKVQFSVPGESMEYLVVGGADMQDVLANYTTLTGKPALPPAWTFGLWLTTSFTTDYDEETVNSFVDGMVEREIPLHTFHFDCFWMKAYNWCDFTWDDEVFPDPEGMLKRLKAKGLHVCVWINPYISQESPMFDEGMAGDYLIKTQEGDIWQWDLWQPGMGVVDFTNPEACAWYESKLKVLMDMGVDTFKTDFGERIPVDVAYHDGSDPYKMHNYYTYLYNKVVFNLLEKELGKNQALVFARSATVGGQQFPVHWGGDCSSNYESMAESLRGGLSLCMSGFGFWSHDIGGFESTSTPDVYKRWAAFGLLSTHSRLHGSSSYRVPWAYDEESVDVVRYFSQLKCTLMPYLFRNAVETSETGVPMMRSMVISYPEDPSCQYLDKQYMLGDSLVVAPIFNEEGKVTYYLPKGRWINYITGEEVYGGSYQKNIFDYLSLPLMMKPGAVIPIGSNNQKPDYEYESGVTYHLNCPDEAMTVTCPIYDTSGEKVSEIEVSYEPGSVKVTRLVGSQAFEVLLRNLESATAQGCNTSSTVQGALININELEIGTSLLIQY